MEHPTTEHEFSFKSLFIPFTNVKAIHWIIFIGLIVYFNSLSSAFISDDIAQIVNNVAIRSLKNIGEFFLSSTFNNGSVGLTGIYYKPMLTTVYAVVYAAFQTWTFPYHFLQLLLHISNAIFILLFIGKYIKKEVAFVTSLIFLLHPINNEAVVSIAALQEPLFLFFGMLALLVTERLSINKISNSIVTILLLISLLSKETGIAFILILPLYLKIFKNKWLPAVYESLFALFAYLFLRLVVAHIFFNQTNIFKYSLTQLPLLQRLTNIPAIVYFYLRTFFYPIYLLTFQRWVISSLNFQNFLLPLLMDILFFGVLILGGFWIHKKYRKQFKIYLFFFLWFVIGLGLHLQVIPLDYTVADRWFYFPIIGLLGMIGLILSLSTFKTKQFSWIVVSFLSVVVLLFAMRDIIRNGDWTNAATLYQHDIQFEPDNYELQSGLGIELYNQGKFAEAKSHLLYSIKLYPTIQNLAALGLLYQKQQNIPAAKKALIQALQIKNDPFVYQTLIKIMLIYDTPQTTINFIKQELQRNSNDPQLWLYLSVENYKLGNKADALTEVKKSYNIYPSQQSQYVYQKIINNQQIKLISNI